MTCAPTMKFKCLECGEAFETTRTDKYHCGTACRKTWNNRAATRGAALYHLAMQWRIERSSDKDASAEAFAELCHVIGRFRDEDNAADKKRYRKFSKSNPN